MDKIIVAGSGTDVGKTVVSAILSTYFQGDYWKPVDCNDDTKRMQELLDPQKHTVFEPAYTFQAYLSPHHAAHLEDRTIDVENIKPPTTSRSLIIESVGGVLVPLTVESLSIDLFASWNCSWIIVSRHYVGSINHTLLTVEALKARGITPLGLVFNGMPNPDSEAAIMLKTKLPFLGRVLPELHMTPQLIQRYAAQWHSLF